MAERKKTAFSFEVPSLVEEQEAKVQFELDYLAELSVERRAAEQLHGPGALLLMDIAELFEQTGGWAKERMKR